MRDKCPVTRGIQAEDRPLLAGHLRDPALAWMTSKALSRLLNSTSAFSGLGLIPQAACLRAPHHPGLGSSVVPLQHHYLTDSLGVLELNTE